MLAMRLPREVAEVQVRKAAPPASDAGHVALLFQGTHEIKGGRGCDVHAGYLVIAEEFEALVESSEIAAKSRSMVFGPFSCLRT